MDRFSPHLISFPGAGGVSIFSLETAPLIERGAHAGARGLCAAPAPTRSC
jgi:hypothetical protein